MVIVVDSSAWIDFFRGRLNPVSSLLRRLVAEKADLTITETILMEVLAGTRSGESLPQVRAQLIGRPILRLEGVADFEEAARIYRACRAAGETLRSQLDCLIAVPTIRHGASLLHNDRDFETIARHTGLRLEPVGPLGPPEERHLRERKGAWKAGTGRAHTRHPRRTRPSSRAAIR